MVLTVLRIPHRFMRPALFAAFAAVVIVAWAVHRPPAPSPAPPPALHLPDRLVLQLSGPRQAQFAGYYVALAKGFYQRAGLEVSIAPGAAGGDSAPLALRPGTDIWSAWLPQALAAREAGADIVNFAQIFPHSGLELVCWKAAVHSPADFSGKTIAVWADVTRMSFHAWMAKLGIADAVHERSMARTSAAPAIAPLLSHAADCITGLTYDQYWSLIRAGIPPGQLQVFHDGDAGVATLQDGLYARAASLADPVQTAVLARFLAASVQGWQYASSHEPEAVAIVLAGHPATAEETLRQTQMMSAVARLTGAGLLPMGYLEPAAFARSVQLLLRPPDPMLHSVPTNAWTHAIWQRAQHKSG